MRFFSIVALLVSVPAFACPDLAGTYSCQDANGQTNTMTVAQELRDGNTVYTAHGMELIADGTERAFQDQHIKGGTIRGYCTGEASLVMEMAGTVVKQGVQMGQFDGVMTIQRAGSELSAVTSGTFNRSGSQEKFTDYSTCTLQ